MPRTEIVLRVFSASPDDVADDRAVLDEVIRELNDTWSKSLGVRLEYVGWETHAYPAVGSDPQAVINDEIGEDYDIFVGMLWTRFGTPTPRGKSGTAEEFERAYERFRRDPSKVHIMVYFKDAPLNVSPTALDLDQLRAVKEFRGSLGEMGTLYWSYSDAKQLGGFLRMHLARVVQKWNSAPASEPSTGKANSMGGSAGTEDLGQRPGNDAEEEGILDLIDQGEQRFEAVNGALTRMADAIKTVGSRMELRAREIESLRANHPVNPRRLKKLVGFAAADMNAFADQVNAEIPLFSKSYTSAMDTFGRAAVLLADFEPIPNQQIADAHEQVGELRLNIERSHAALSQMRGEVSSIPRLSTDMNRARRAATSALDRLDLEFSNALNVTSEIEKLLQRMLPSAKGNGVQ